VNPIACTLLLVGTIPLGAAPVLLDDQFQLPGGFHIYKAASPERTGGSYDLAFDGDGRLLVGDGKAVRRLYDDDRDGVYDRHEVLVEGLGSRGPQGLLVSGDRLYAVGGDGVQLFEGYRDGGTLVHRGRLSEPFNTGGDHSAHTLLRGHDGFIYFVTGDGGGTEGRRHITERTSPALRERAASVFRFSPDGARWECLATGGRNPPNLGMNHLGELFSWDSDMEWHVDLPFYRPLRLNHWVQGGDQGWQGVGAFPDYYVDALPPVLATGRGSPDWGVFYEHRQFPAKYSDAFFVCDYLWKSATSGQYNTTGQLNVFFLAREGAHWSATMETLARPRQGARDAYDRPISFGLVDVEVAPDGSLLVTDHNQGVWRIFYASDHRAGQPGPALLPPPAPPPSSPDAIMEAALQLPQPGSEWAQVQWETLREQLGASWQSRFQSLALDPARTLPERLRAVRFLAPEFASLPDTFLAGLALKQAPELRGQAAWLLGLRSDGRSHPLLLALLHDPDPFVRRRAAEGLTRSWDPGACRSLLTALSDPDRLVRYVAMNVLAHRPAEAWIEDALQSEVPQVRLRALVAFRLQGGEATSPLALRGVQELMRGRGLNDEDRLDLLRVVGLYREPLGDLSEVRPLMREFLLTSLARPDPRLRWEAAGLLGECNVPEGFAPLLALLEMETDPVTQFHLAQALARINPVGEKEEVLRLKDWFIASQHGWFAEFDGKGRQFPDFWGTVLANYVARHQALLAGNKEGIQPESQLGRALQEALNRGDAPRLAGCTRPELSPSANLHSNEALLDFLAGDRVRGGDPRRGREVFARAQCQQCHGDPSDGGRLFGPELAGVTRRLNRTELAEAMVLPSKLVVDRFRATEVELKDGSVLAGFVTERDDDILTLSVQDSIQRIPLANIESVRPQARSLMPDGLLNGLRWRDIRDLFAYLDALGTEKQGREAPLPEGCTPSPAQGLGGASFDASSNID